MGRRKKFIDKNAPGTYTFKLLPASSCGSTSAVTDATTTTVGTSEYISRRRREDALIGMLDGTGASPSSAGSKVEVDSSSSSVSAQSGMTAPIRHILRPIPVKRSEKKAVDLTLQARSPKVPKFLQTVLEPAHFGIHDRLDLDEFAELVYDTYGEDVSELCGPLKAQLEKIRLSIEARQQAISSCGKQIIDAETLEFVECYFPPDGYDYEQHLRTCNGPLARPLAPASQKTPELNEGGAVSAVTPPVDFAVVDLSSGRRHALSESEKEVLAALDDCAAVDSSLEEDFVTAAGGVEALRGPSEKVAAAELALLWGNHKLQLEDVAAVNMLPFEKAQMRALLRATRRPSELSESTSGETEYSVEQLDEEGALSSDDSESDIDSKDSDANNDGGKASRRSPQRRVRFNNTAPLDISHCQTPSPLEAELAHVLEEEYNEADFGALSGDEDSDLDSTGDPRHSLEEFRGMLSEFLRGNTRRARKYQCSGTNADESFFGVGELPASALNKLPANAVVLRPKGLQASSVDDDEDVISSDAGKILSFFKRLIETDPKCTMDPIEALYPGYATESTEEEWDCETILTTRTNLYNHPTKVSNCPDGRRSNPATLPTKTIEKLIKAKTVADYMRALSRTQNPRSSDDRTKNRTLDAHHKTTFPSEAPSSGQSGSPAPLFQVVTPIVPVVTKRRKNETREEKRERQLAVKQAQRMARQSRKAAATLQKMQQSSTRSRKAFRRPGAVSAQLSPPGQCY